MTTQVDMAALERWIGNTEVVDDEITPRMALSYHATFGLDGEPPARGEALPHGFHWLLCPPIAEAAALGPDGHPARGGFLPPVPLPRRMWAGSRIELLDAFRVGDSVRRTSKVVSLTAKQGRSGELVFLQLEHSFDAGGRTCLRETQNVVYREPPPPGADSAPAPAANEGGEPVRVLEPDAPMLFRYSAITFNGHRIHYDADYCRNVEGYPNCIIHGPVTGTTLMLAAQDVAGDTRLAAFEFRARSPAFLGDSVRVFVTGSDTGRIEVEARNQDGTTLMSGTAELDT